MKVYTKLVIDMDSGDVIESDSFEYNGPVAQCISFGSGGERYGSKPVQVPTWNPEQQALFQALMPHIAGGLGYEYVPGEETGGGGDSWVSSFADPPLQSGGTYVQTGTEGVPSYPGQLYVPRTGEEDAYFGRESAFAEDLARMRAGLSSTEEDINSRLAQSLAGIGMTYDELLKMRDTAGEAAFQITPETTEQYYQQSVRAPAMQEWSEIVEPQIRESFVGPGYWGSARAQGQQRGAEHLATELGRQRAELYYADEMARREALEAAAMREAGFAPYVAGVGTAGAELGVRGAELGSQFGLSRAGLDMAGAERAEMFAEEKARSAAEYSRKIEEDKVIGELQRWLMGETVDGVTPSQYNPFLQLAFQALGLSPFAVGTESYGKGSNFQFGIASDIL